MRKYFVRLASLLSLVVLAQTALAQVNTGIINNLMHDNTKTLAEITAEANTYFQQVGTGRGTGYKQFQRWLYEQSFHRDANGYAIDPQVEYDAYTTAVQQMQQRQTRAAWSEMGPNTFSVTTSWNPGVGRCNAVALLASSPSTIYAASGGGGIWKSTDGGATWAAKTDAYANSYFQIEYITIDPSNANTIYACIEGGGVIKSTDGGNTWAATGTGPSSAKRVLVHPTNSSNLLSTGTNGIYRSTNGGTNWTQVSTGNFEDICYQPGSTSNVYAAGASTTTFRRSTDGGATWSTVTTGITNSGRTLIGVSANNAQVVYLLQSNPSDQSFGRLYKSTNGGTSFTTTVTGGANTNYFGYETNGTGLGGQAYYDMGIAVNPSNVNEVHIAGIICWKSTNGGTSFTATTAWSYPNSIGYNHADVHQLLWVGTTLYSATDGGISKSTNNGDDWVNIWTGMGTKMIYRLATSKTSSSTLAFGSQDNGQTYRLNGGAWNQWMGADGMDCAISSTNSSVGIGTYQNGGIYRTTNGGVSSTSLTPPANGNWVTPIAWHPNDANTVFAGYNGVYKSTNQGTNWTKISGTTISSNMDCIAIAPSNANYIYGSVGSTLYVSTNGGTSWSTYSPGAGAITSICVSPLTPSKVWISTSSSSNQVRVSTNSGSTFTSISSGLPAIAARSVAVEDNTAETIYVGMNYGVYSKDNNTSWAVFGTGLPNVSINDVEVHKGAGKLRIGTYGRGIWETDLATVGTGCSAPTGLASSNITTSGATVSWAAVGGASSYVVEYKTSSAITWTVLASQTTTSANLSGLAASTGYDWRVKTNCTGSSSTYASGVFTTLSSGGTCAAPSTITAINTNANAVNFTWPAVAGASGYTVEYKLSTTSTWTTANTTSASYNASGLAAGVYNCRVKTNCAINVSSAYTNGANFQAYCTAGGNTADEFIDNVAVKTIARTSGADGGYIFLLSPKPNIVPGTTYTLTYSAGYTSTVYTEVFKAYIDYNRDGDFVDANETLFTQTVTNGNNTTSTFTVPSTATLGSSVLRIQMNYNAAATSPCGTLQYGEIEDYAINLSTTPSLQNSPEVESALSLKETGLVIYPNPSAQTIYYEVHNIDKSCNALVQIISIDGKVMQQVPVSLEASSDNKNSLDISQLRTGNYFIRVINDEVRMQGSFIKE